jgi:hypothetical protein
MLHSVDLFSKWIKDIGLQGFIDHYGWIIPGSQAVHFFGLALLFGIIGLLDLRMVGLLKGLPIKPLTRLIPLAMAGFAVNVVTGFILFAGAPNMFSHNMAFQWKMTFIVVAGANALFFLVSGLQKRCEELGPNDDVPAGAKAVAIISMSMWIGVMFWGRMLPFLGDAF